MPIDWRRTEKAARFDHGGPIRYLSLAPLAGVILVVAAVTAMAYPMQQDVLLFDLPYVDDFGELPSPAPHRITLDHVGEIRWDGVAVTTVELGMRLSEAENQYVERGINFQPAANASYGSTLEVLAVLATMDEADFCVEGMDRYRKFRKSPSVQTEAGTEGAEFSPYTYCDLFAVHISN